MTHILTSSGLKPDPDKVEAIKKMPRATDNTGVRRIIGMATYLSKFLENLSALCEPLRQLTRQDVQWTWTAKHDDAQQKIKNAETQTPVLKYFNAKDKTTLQCDSSKSGLEAELMQNGQPVSYASRPLTETKQKYSQI